MAWLSRLLSVAFASTFSACGPSDEVVAQCTDQCLAAADCPGAADGCPELCEEERSFAERIECTTEYETMLDCLDTATDVCDQFASCPEEVSVYFTCFGDYCVAHPDDSQCAPQQ